MIPPAPLRQIPIPQVLSRQVLKDPNTRNEIAKEAGLILPGFNSILNENIQDLVEHNPTHIGIGHSTPIPNEYNPLSPTSSSRCDPITFVAAQSLARYIANSYSISKMCESE